jgi:predicted nucleic acid-binding protein
MSRGVTYLDSSAIVKLIVAEPESESLRDWIRERPRIASCALARTEVPRAVRHVGAAALAGARGALRDIDLIAVDDRLLETAAILDPAILRSLDAIHLAAARSLGSDLDVVVSYDTRMLEGARLLGLPTERPT